MEGRLSGFEGMSGTLFFSLYGLNPYKEHGEKSGRDDYSGDEDADSVLLYILTPRGKREASEDCGEYPDFPT